MLVQRVVMPARGVQSWTVLGDDDVPIGPVERYLAYLSDVERSPNTVKAYAHDLKDFWTFLMLGSSRDTCSCGNEPIFNSADLLECCQLGIDPLVSLPGPARGGGGRRPPSDSCSSSRKSHLGARLQDDVDLGSRTRPDRRNNAPMIHCLPLLHVSRLDPNLAQQRWSSCPCGQDCGQQVTDAAVLRAVRDDLQLLPDTISA